MIDYRPFPKIPRIWFISFLKCQNIKMVRLLTLHVAHQPVLVHQPVVRPLLSEGDLDTVLHLDVIDLGKAPDEEVHHYQSGII